MRAFIFPGQGSQFVGMGLDFYKKFDLVKKNFKIVDDTLGYSLSEIIFNGPDNLLKLTQNTQPAIMTVGVSIFNVLNQNYGLNLNNSKYFAGHSLGEYTALVCAGSLSLERAAYLLHERGKAMQESAPEGQGAMLAVLGVAPNTVEEYIKKIDKKNGECEIANDNSDSQIILSGNRKAIEEMHKLMKENKKKSMFLPVSAPFHSSLMKTAAQNMKDKIQNTSFQNPSIDLVTNVTAQSTKNPEEIKKLLVDQIYSKVRWRESILYMIENGVNEFIEIGPGKVLTGLVKRISGKVNVKSINTISDIETLK